MNGYKTDDPCEVCGQVFFNLIESKFGYVVCMDHYDTMPIDVPR